ncbi:hypothetical protein AMTR_s02017p00002380 [Amborella trichopoda]|uniref:Pentatricopeptide repeat-containing protein n=1 Tax=Amborella trichopoda TaxID=13333 RepID=U5CUU3_AMBTC|nr:hypothetical protein AMTR_s02017p00002380 [Amborella trichopoda]
MEILHLVLAEDHVPDHFVYNFIIERLYKEERFEEAGQFLKNKLELDSYSYCILFGSYCDLQRWEDAAGVILEMTQSELDLDSLTCNTVIKSFCNVGLLSHPIFVLEEMIAREIPTNA